MGDFTPAQLRTIRETVAADTNAHEFDLFMNAARNYGLDPFRKQISAIVFNKDKGDRRRMAIIVGRDGLRVIAARCGDYRPADRPTQFVIDDALKSETNPKGLLSAGVTLYKQDKKGDWYSVYGEAFWDEFAPVKDEWAYDAEKGQRAPTGKQTVDGTWAKMPTLMLAKCAEAQALRAGWPEQFGGLYVEEEMHIHTMTRDNGKTDLSPSEQVEQEKQNQRQKMLGRDAVLLNMDGSGALQRVPVGEVADRCFEFFKSADAETVYRWSVQNKEGLRDFWTVAPSDALEVKKAMERKVNEYLAGSGEAA